jgi:subtilisin family serine protease
MEPVTDSLESDSPWDSSKSTQGEELSSQFFSDFSASLTTFYNSTSESGDYLPYGVKAAWKGLDYTGDEWLDSVNLGEGIQITDDTWDVGKGISTYLLEGMGLDSVGATNKSAKVQKFAIVLDTGVAEIDNLDGTGDLNVGKFASSNYFDYENAGVFADFTTDGLGGLSEILTDAEDNSYYSVSQVLSASFVDQNFDAELWNDDPFQDGNAHGTHVAGTIAAKADGKGVVGVAPGAEIIAMKVLSDSGGGTFAGVMAGISQAGDYILQDTYDITDSVGNVIQTIDTSMVTKENTVINMSLGGQGIMQACLDLIDGYSDQGVVFSLAAGNDSKDVDGITPAAAGDSADLAIVPGGSANTWTVSAVDNKYNNAWFTNFDNDDDNGANDNSTVSAAGVSVYSYNQGSGGNGMGNLSGTSMAAPAVAGLLLMDPMDIAIDTDEDGAPVVLSSQWYEQGDDGETNWDVSLDAIGAGSNNDYIGIQLGDDALPVNAAPYVDPFALTTLELLGDSDAGYTPEDPIEDVPDEGDGDEDDIPDESPWNGYDPTKTYYDTVGYVNGTNGTYVLSTGYGAAAKSSLADTLSIDASKLDGSMLLTENDISNPGQENDGTKSAIYTTEGSGVKLTGFAAVGDTVGFEYVLSTNDYTPYSDFAFVQLETGNDTTANSDILDFSTIGAVGLDLANFGTKVGYYEYTFVEGDFGDDIDEVVETEGFYNLSVGVVDAIDTWVDTTLMVKSLGAGGDSSQASGTYDAYEFTWDENGLGNAVATNTTGDVKDFVWNMSSGSASVSQAVLEVSLGGGDMVGELDTDLNGTKASINATEGSGTFATVLGKIGDVVSFDWYFDTNDYSPYKDFSFYTVNGEAFKLGALGENVADFGAADGNVFFELTEDMFDMSTYVSESDASNDSPEGGELLIGFGVVDALDWCVSSNLEITNLQYLDPSDESFADPDDGYDNSDAVGDLGSWSYEVFGNYWIEDADALDDGLGGADADSPKFYLADIATAFAVEEDAKYIFASSDDDTANAGYELTLSTQWASGDFALVEQQTLEYLADLDSGYLDTDIDGSKNAINAQSGSAVTLNGVAKAGDIVSFDFLFDSDDYIPFQDFAYFTVNGNGDTLADVQYQPGNGLDNEDSGSFLYEITTSDLDGELVGEVMISVGIVNALDNAVASQITLSNFEFSESTYYDEESDSFEDSYDYFEIKSVGDVFGDLEDGFALSTGGDTVSVSEIEDFLSNPSGEYEYGTGVSLSNPMYFDEDDTLLNLQYKRRKVQL